MTNEAVWAIWGCLVAAGGAVLGSVIWMWGYCQGCAVTREIMNPHISQRKDRP